MRGVRIVSWPTRMAVAGWWLVISGAFAGSALEMNPEGQGTVVVWGMAAVSALAFVRAMRAGVFLRRERLLIRGILLSRSIPVSRVASVHLGDFAGFFLFTSVRSVYVRLTDGGSVAAAMVSGRRGALRPKVERANRELRARASREHGSSPDHGGPP